MLTWLLSCLRVIKHLTTGVTTSLKYIYPDLLLWGVWTPTLHKCLHRSITSDFGSNICHHSARSHSKNVSDTAAWSVAPPRDSIKSEAGSLSLGWLDGSFTGSFLQRPRLRLVCDRESRVMFLIHVTLVSERTIWCQVCYVAYVTYIMLRYIKPHYEPFPNLIKYLFFAWTLPKHLLSPTGCCTLRIVANLTTCPLFIIYLHYVPKLKLHHVCNLKVQYVRIDHFEFILPTNWSSSLLWIVLFFYIIFYKSIESF